MNDTTTATPAGGTAARFVRILFLDCGEYRPPASLIEAMKNMPMLRRAYEIDGKTHYCHEPDPKTDEGRRFYEWLQRENARCTTAYVKREDFTLAEFN